MSNKLVKDKNGINQIHVGDSAKVVSAIESERDKEERHWKNARVNAFIITILAMGSSIFVVDGSLYSICEKIGLSMNVQGKYILIVVVILQFLIMVCGIIRLWYAHMQCLKRGISDRLW